MRTIFKYAIEITDVQVIHVKAGAVPLHVGLDPHGAPCIWMKVNRDYDTEALVVYVVGTGHPLPTDAEIHLGSFNQGPFVWHVFVKNKETPI